MNRMIFLFATIIFTIFPDAKSFSQASITHNGEKSYTLVERTDLSRYDNGKYQGLIAREVRSFISRSPASKASDKNSYLYDGNFYLTEQTVHAKKEVFKGIHDSIPSVFTINQNGSLSMIVDNGFPSFRSFPAFPSGKLTPGASWQANAVRAVDPLNKGIVTKLQMVVAYTFAGEETYHNQSVYKITAKWATRYDQRHLDYNGDKSLKNATGTHEANILVSKATGNAILIHDRVDETFTYDTGLSVRLKGTISQFTEYPPAVEHKKLIPALQRIAKFVPSEKGTLSSHEISNPASNSDFIENKYLLPDAESGKNTTTRSQTSNAAKSSERMQPNQPYQPYQAAKPKDSTPRQNASGQLPGTSASTKIAAAGKTGSTQASAEKSKTSGTKSERSAKSEKVSASELLADAGILNSGKKTSAKIPVPSSVPEPEKVQPDDFNSMVVEETPAGLRLSVRDIRFKPDSDEILPEELSRLDQIAEVLRLVPDSHFLIEGHSASVGNPKGELEVSQKRSKAIAMQLSKRGINADHFICRGYGAERPIASNSTTQGKALNRRVEITILE